MQRISDVAPDEVDDGASMAPGVETPAAATVSIARHDDWAKR